MKRDHDLGFLEQADPASEKDHPAPAPGSSVLAPHALALLDAVPHALFLFREGEIVFANAAAKSFFGLGPEGLPGSAQENLSASPNDYEKIRTFLSGHLKDPGNNSEPAPWICKDGRTIHCKIQERIVPCANGQRLAVVTCRDTTEHEPAREAVRKTEEKYSRLLEAIGSAYYELDNSGNFTFVNGALRRGMGYREEEIRGTHYSAFMNKQNAGMAKRLFGQLYAGTSSSLNFEVEMIRKNGSRVYIESWVSALHDESGAMVGIQGIGREVTDRRHAQDALRQNEEKYGRLLESIEASYFEMDVSGNIVFFNGALCKGTGYREEELKGMSYAKLMERKDAERLYAVFSDLYASDRSSLNFELEMIRKNGEKIYAEIWISVLRDEAGRPLGLQGIGHDITERKLAQQALEQSEERYRDHFTSVSDVIYTIDRNYCILSISPSVERVLGYIPEELVGRNFAEVGIVPMEYMDQAYRNAQTLFSGSQTQASLYEFIAKDGTKKYGEISGTPISRNGKAVGALCVARDVTERIRAENAVDESERRYRDIFDNVSDVLFFHDMEGYLHVDRVNKAGRTIWGVGFDQDVKVNIKDLIAPQYRHEFEKYIRRIQTKGKDEGYVAILDSKGRERVLDYRNSLVYEGGVSIGVRGSARDISDRVRAETELKKSEEKYRTILKEIEDGYFEVDLKGTFTFFNDSMCTLLGYSRAEMKGMNNRQYADKENAASIYASFNRVFKTGKSDKGFVWELVRKDGARVYVESSVSLIRDPEGNAVGFRGTCRDITRRVQEEEERKKLEHRLQQAKKMEAIGTLAGGVAHDLNNILSGLVSYPELILMDLPDDDPLRKPISTIRQSGEKAAAIVQDLLTLARRGVTTSEVISPSSVISEYFRSPELVKLKADYPGIRVDVHCDPHLLPILGSPFHLGKTITNLVTNAAEAIYDEGTITVTARNVYLDRPIKGYDKIREGEYVAVTVSDTGVGISDEDRERIFEPFYTKKVMGRSGTGLGMTVVWGTVQDHHGYIEIKSGEGEGTAITVYLPVTRAAIKDRPVGDIQDFMGHGETIVVVDDVELQRDIATRILTRLGYSVLSFASGEEAVEHMKDHSADLMVLDMIMDPGIDGLETYRRVLNFHPGQKVIIASGYSETKQVRELQQLGAGAYIKKPYLIETLGLAIRNELDKTKDAEQ